MNPRRLAFLAPAAVAAVVTLWPVAAAAERRVARRSPVRVAVGIGYGYPIDASPFFYDYYSPFGWGLYGYQYRPYPPYPPFGYYDPTADLRIQVTPRQAEVYIDGYLTGTVDNFDGVFQRLRVPLGEHEITIYAEGYQTLTERMLFRPYESYHIKQAMQPLAAGAASEPRPAPAARPEAAPPGRPGRAPADRRAPEPADRYGTVAVRVQPADAELLIDGEPWASSGDDRVLVQVSEGSHRIEVRKAGYRTYTSTMRVRAGETLTLNVSLSAGG